MIQPFPTIRRPIRPSPLPAALPPALAFADDVDWSSSASDEESIAWSLPGRCRSYGCRALALTPRPTACA
ncbi:hypothetical protein GQ55_8G185700 [Panicum hallii var. hallii]|uniref:Uncharacterized protein n=1 Tax=Panicum hallii var. hallii TaxID=1504633 RepID=A0A2T7CNU2_9POAL|nr:hypothetical protein GQ55_8G185700 [Panicum hallii var. hallii]